MKNFVGFWQDLRSHTSIRFHAYVCIKFQNEFLYIHVYENHPYLTPDDNLIAVAVTDWGLLLVRVVESDRHGRLRDACLALLEDQIRQIL